MQKLDHALTKKIIETAGKKYMLRFSAYLLKTARIKTRSTSKWSFQVNYLLLKVIQNSHIKSASSTTALPTKFHSIKTKPH